MIVCRASAKLPSQLLHLGAIRLPHCHQRRERIPQSQALLDLIRHVHVHVGHDRAGVDGVDRGALRKLAAPDAGQRFQGTLSAGVQARVGSADLAVDAGDHDDAARSVGGQIRLAGGRQQRGAEDVDGVDVVELGLDDALEGAHVQDGGVVDEDVDLERGIGEGGLGRVDHLGAAFGLADVSADRDGLDAVRGLDLFAQIKSRLVGRWCDVIHHHVATLAS